MNTSEQKALDEPSSPAEHLTYTLEPLRAEGPDALDTHDLPGIKTIRLCELELAFEDPYHDTTIIRGASLFKSAAAKSKPVPLIPPRAVLAGAAFEIQPSNEDRICTVHIRPPHGLQVTRSSMSPVVHSWMLKHHFQTLALVIHVLLGIDLPTPFLDSHETGEPTPGYQPEC